MHTTEALLHRSLSAVDAGFTLTLDPSFQGLPATAHGGSVLAAFDAIAGRSTARRLSGTYRRRVPLGVPLRVDVRRTDEHAGGRTRCRLLEGDSVLVEGEIAAAALPDGSAVVDDEAGTALPISNTCFVCGRENPAGLHARLRFDDRGVFGAWTPPDRMRAADGRLAVIAVTSLLDEAAFWLGALASGESGMTTDLAVTVAPALAFGASLAIRGERARVQPRPDDGRYWRTHAVACDGRGRVVAEADITFVAIRGTARKLAGWLNPLNPPGLMSRIFPAYA